MEYTVQIHWQIRKGSGPDWVNKTSEIFIDDLEEETTIQDAKEIAIYLFKLERHRNGTASTEYIINEVNLS